MLNRIPQRWLMAAITVVAGLLAAWAARQHIQGRIAQIEPDAEPAHQPRRQQPVELVPDQEHDGGEHVEQHRGREQGAPPEPVGEVTREVEAGRDTDALQPVAA